MPEEILTIVVVALAGVLAWRSLVAIKRNAREIAQGPSADALHRLHEAISELREETESLRADLQEQRAQLGEALERLDFAERVVSQVRERAPLPPGSST